LISDISSYQFRIFCHSREPTGNAAAVGQFHIVACAGFHNALFFFVYTACGPFASNQVPGYECLDAEFSANLSEYRI
jgi:hypothetical protein